MCERGKVKQVLTCGPKSEVVDVDECIAPFIQWLNDNNVRTMSSCCGHGQTEGGNRMSLIIDVHSVMNREFSGD